MVDGDGDDDDGLGLLSAHDAGTRVLLALYAFTVFGYVTATLATFFVDREAASPESDIPDQKGIEALRREVAGLRSEIQALVAATAGPARPPDSQPTA